MILVYNNLHSNRLDHFTIYIAFQFIIPLPLPSQFAKIKELPLPPLPPPPQFIVKHLPQLSCTLINRYILHLL